MDRNNSVLIQRLIDINAILRQSGTSVFDRYGGIAELTLFRDERKVGVLTIGLIDENTQVRELAANELEKNYDLGETSREVLALLEHQEAGLRAAYIDREQDRFGVLLDKLGQLLRLEERGGRRKFFEKDDNGWVEYDRRHALTILRGLGQVLKRIQAKQGNSGRHPLKGMLEEEKNRWILRLIQQCLEKSDDIFCRRDAIVAIGELGLDFDQHQQAYDVIRVAIDSPNNRHDYMTTKDGIRALTALVKQDPMLAERFYADIRAIYCKRDYDVAFQERDWHRHYTRQDCFGALAELHTFDQIKLLLQDGEDKNFLHMMFPDQNAKISKYLKFAIIDAYIHIYQQESQQSTGTITPIQVEILETIGTWLGSKDNAVRQYAWRFFGHFPDVDQALVYLLRSAESNNEEIGRCWATFQADSLAEESKAYDQWLEQIEELLADRKEFVLLFGAIFTRFASDDPGMLMLRTQGYNLLRKWCLQRFSDEERELANSRLARLESLWLLYDLERSTLTAPSHSSTVQINLSPAEITELHKQEASDAAFLCVLVLFKALHVREQFVDYLSEVTRSRYPEAVRACAKLELLIQRYYSGDLAGAPDLSLDEVELIAKALEAKSGDVRYPLHERLVSRFIPVLANMDTPCASELVGRVIESRTDRALQLREELDGYHCYQHHMTIFGMLLQHLSLHRTGLKHLRVDYVNLLRAGVYQRSLAKPSSIAYELEQRDPLQEKVLAGLRAIARSFQPMDLTLLFPLETERTESAQHAERVVALESFSFEAIHTMLYAVDRKEDGKPGIKGYGRIPQLKFEGCWIFLKRVITDWEIARVMRERIEKLKLEGRPTANSVFFRGSTEKGIIGFLVGQVIRSDNAGLYIDIGLRRYTPLVLKADVVHHDEVLSPAEWQEYATGLEGSYLVFRVNKVTFDTRTDLIEDLELTRRLGPRREPSRSDFILELLQVADGKTFAATAKELGQVDRRNPAAIFRVTGRDVEVPFHELSWKKSSVSEWLEGRWREEIENRSEQVYELSYRESDIASEKKWSLRENTPTREHFAELLFEKGTQDFSLTYAAQEAFAWQEKQGLIFEITPGRNCYVPADRLVLGFSEKGRVNFLFPNRSLEAGDTLRVQFEFQRINGQPEVVLHVLDIEQVPNKERLPRGMKIVGQLAHYNGKQSMGRLEPDDRLLKSYTIEIEALPDYDPDDPARELGVGCALSGYILTVNDEELYIKLRYAPTLPAELKEDYVYPCWIKYDPRPETGYITLSYANVKGMLREREMTYGHMPVLAGYQRGQVLKARVVKRINWENKDNFEQTEAALTARYYDVTLTNLGLKQRLSVEGDVVSTYQGRIGAVQGEDGKAFEFDLDDFTFSNEPPRIEPGNRIEFVRDPKKDKHLKLIVKRAKILFTILPRLDHGEDWTKPTRALPEGKEVACVYVQHDNEVALFESKPGEVFALSLTTLPWLYTDEEDNVGDAEVMVMQEGRLARYPLAIGDVLTLLRYERDDTVQLQQFRQGPLHFLANPGLLNGAAYAPFPIFGTILRSSSLWAAKETGKRVELTHYYTPDGEKHLLRSGIIGIYRENKMGLRDKQLFNSNRLNEGHEVKIFLCGTPTLHGSKLRLPLLDGDTSVESLKTLVALPTTDIEAQPPFLLESLRPRIPLEERLKELVRIISDNPERTFEGKIKLYRSELQAFLVSLDDIGDDRYLCKLPHDQVSFNPDRQYRSLAAFTDGLRRKFTVMHVDVENAEIVVSLIQNTPLGIDETGDEENWSEGQLLKLATFVEYHPKEDSIQPTYTPDLLAHKGESELADVIGKEESKIARTFEGMVIIEITPGLVVAIPIERFYVDGVPFLLHDANYHPKEGDQLGLRVVKEADQFGLDVTMLQPAHINVLSNSRRVIAGWVDRSVDGVDGQKFPLKLVGFELPCFLDIERKLSQRELAEVDLFRFSRREGHELYFRPVTELKKGDILRVVYEGIAQDRANALNVAFGTKKHAGHVRFHDISYQPNFQPSNFHVELNYECDVVVIRDTAEFLRTPVLLSMRDAPSRPFRYFQERLIQQKLLGHTFSTIVVRQNPGKVFLDIEISDAKIEPGTVISVPHQKIVLSPDLNKTRQELIDGLLPGDLLQCTLQLREQYTLLRVESMIKSVLHDLTINTLVRVQLDKRSKDGKWFFSLPDYNAYPGILHSRLGAESGFLPGVVSDDMRLVVGEQVAKKSFGQPIRLRQRTADDVQLIVRVKSIGIDYIEVMREDGQSWRIFNRNATYRVNKRSSYLKRFLPVDRVLIVTQREGTRELSLLEINPAPFAALRSHLHTGEDVQELIELTYIRTLKGENHVFELRPGELYLVPVQALYFGEHPLRDFSGLSSTNGSSRFLPGDVFTVFVQHPPRGGQDELRVAVTSIELSAIHFWHPSMFAQARIVERSNNGVMINVGDLEEFVEKNQLLGVAEFDMLNEGDAIWFQVIRVEEENRRILLKPVAEPSWQEMRKNAAERKKVEHILYSNIVQREKQRVTLELLGEKRVVSLPFISWVETGQEDTVDDQLVPGEMGMWVRVALREGNVSVNPKQAIIAQAQRLKANEIVQARVLNANARSRTVLVDVDGVRTLIDNSDLMWGAPSELACVERGMWMAVRVQSIEATSLASPAMYRLLVSGRAVSDTLDHLRIKERFEAVVLYTLPHGLVFCYKQALGYIPNTHIAWSERTRAQDMFKPGQTINVYKRVDCRQRFPFSLKDLSQIARLRIGDEVEATVLSKVEAGIYVEVAPLYAFVSRYQLGAGQLETLASGDSIALIYDEADPSRMTTVFRVKQEVSEKARYELLLDTEILRQKLDFSYADAFNRFSSLVHDRKAKFEKMLDQPNESKEVIDSKQSPLVSTLRGEATVGDYLVELLNQHKIHCTYRNIRMLLAFLWKQPYWASLLKQLAEVKVRDRDHITGFVLCQAARECIKGKQEMEGITGYAVGIMAFAPGDMGDISVEPTRAIEYLLYAYQFDKALEIEVALLLLYNYIGNSMLTRAFLKRAVSKIASNIGWLLKLPPPLELDADYYRQLLAKEGIYDKARIPGLDQYPHEVAEEMKRINALLREGWVTDAERALRDKWTRLDRASMNVMEFDLNLALCRILQQDYKDARRYLDRAEDILSQDDPLPGAREHYYQLALHVHYHQGNFNQLQESLQKRFQQATDQWLETLLGYVFFATEHYQLSREIAHHSPLPAQPNRRHMLQLEHILLAVHWETDEDQYKKGMELLRKTLFQRDWHGIGEYGQSESKDIWRQATRTIRIFPSVRDLPFKELVRLAQEMDTPEYLLHEYYNNPILRSELSNWKVTAGLVDLVMRTLEPPPVEDASVAEGSADPRALQNALKMLDEYFKRQIKREDFPEAAGLVADFYKSLYLTDGFNAFKRENRGVNWGEVEQGLARTPGRRELIERWMKSPYDQALIGRKLIALFQASPDLSRVYWERQELRDQIWEAFDLCMDYGALADLLDFQKEELSLAALEDAIFHLLSLGMKPCAFSLLEERKRRQGLKEAEKVYLDELSHMCEQDGPSDFRTMLPSLLVRSPQRSLEFYVPSTSQRQLAIHILQVLIKYPDRTRQIPMMLLLGELYEIDQQYQAASVLYVQVAELAESSSINQLLALLHLLRFRIMHLTDVNPTDLADLHRVRRSAFARLLLGLQKLADGMPASVACPRLTELIGRLQAVLDMHFQKSERRALFLAQLEAFLYALYTFSQVMPDHNILVPFYTFLIGTDPLEGWYTNDEQQMFSLFVDYALAVDRVDELKETVDLTLAATITRYEVLVRAGRQADQKHLIALNRFQKYLSYVRVWTSPHALAQMPEQIEPHAKAVQEFLDAGVRLSQQLLQNATEQLERILGTTSEHYGSSMNMLIVRHFLQQGNWQSARKQAIVTSGGRSGKVSEEILLEIVFACLACNEIEAAKQVRAAMTEREVCYAVDQLIKLLERQPVQQGRKALQQKLRENIDFMQNHGQAKAIYWYIQLLREQIKDIEFDDDLWRHFLRSAIESDIPPREGLSVAKEAYQSMRHPSMILTASHITRYVCHHAATEREVLSDLLLSVAQHDLSFSRDVLMKQMLLQELALLSTQEPA